MNNDPALDALTNQRVQITLGGALYSARRATLYDVGLVNRFRREREQAGDDANIDLDASLFVLCELMKPNASFTVEQLAQSIPFTAYTDIPAALEAVGFTLPQVP